MTDKLKTEIDAIFAAQSDAAQRLARETEEKKRALARIAAEMAVLKDAVVAPAFEEFRGLLTSKGYECKVVDDSARNLQRPRLTFFLVKSGGQVDVRTPCLAVDFDISTGRVEFRQTAAHHSGQPVGTLKAAEVRQDVVEEKLLALLRQAVK